MASTIDSIQRFFGKKTPEEMVKKWRQDIRGQERALERQLRGIEVEEARVKKSLKALAKRGDKKDCTTLAKELVRSKKHKERIHTSKAQLNSIIMQLNHQLATLKIAGTLQKSSEIMKLVNQVVRLPEISQAMQEMSMEMMKAGVMDEMLQDSMDALDDDELEEEAEEEVNKVLFQVTDGLLGEAGQVGAPLDVPELPTSEDESEPELDIMQKRLQALKG